MAEAERRLFIGGSRVKTHPSGSLPVQGDQVSLYLLALPWITVSAFLAFAYMLPSLPLLELNERISP